MTEVLNRCSYQIGFGGGYQCKLTGEVCRKKSDLTCVSVGVTLDEINECAGNATGRPGHQKSPSLKNIAQRRIGGHGTPRKTENKVEAEDSKQFTQRK